MMWAITEILSQVGFNNKEIYITLHEVEWLGKSSDFVI